MEPSCSNCKFFRKSTCRRSPPVGQMGVWPTVFEEDWCGKHVPLSAGLSGPGRPRNYTRDEVIEHIRAGLPKPWQVRPRRESPSRCASYSRIQNQLIKEGIAVVTPDAVVLAAEPQSPAEPLEV